MVNPQRITAPINDKKFFKPSFIDSIIASFTVKFASIIFSILIKLNDNNYPKIINNIQILAIIY